MSLDFPHFFILQFLKTGIYVTQDTAEEKHEISSVLILCAQSWDYRHSKSYPVYMVLGIKSRPLFMLGRHFLTNKHCQMTRQHFNWCLILASVITAQIMQFIFIVNGHSFHIDDNQIILRFFFFLEHSLPVLFFQQLILLQSFMCVVLVFTCVYKLKIDVSDKIWNMPRRSHSK